MRDHRISSTAGQGINQMSKQSKDQAAMIERRKMETMRKKETSMDQMFHRPFVNAGAPSHGVMEGPDKKNAGPVEKVEVCGYGYKGYDSKAWKY